MSTRDFLILVAICVGWAMNTIVSKLVVDTLAVPPIFYAVVRSGVVAAVLLPWLRPLPDRLGRVLLVTLMIGGGSFGLLFIGLRDATSSATAIVSLLGAPMTVGFAILLLGERVGWRRAVGIALTVVGVGVVIVDPAGVHGSAGLFFVAAAILVGSLGAVLLKTLETDPLRLQAWGGVSGLVALAPLTLLIEDGQTVAARAGGWSFAAAVAFSALVVSVVGHTRYYALLQRYDANLIAPLTLMTPIFTILLGVWLFDDAVGWPLAAGGTLALVGVLVIVARPTRRLPKWLLIGNRS